MQSPVASSTYTDFGELNALRAQAQVDPQSSLKQVAKQFEGIFIQMMLKSMRDASMGDDIFDSDQSKVYRDMFDKQVSLDMANSKGIGIAESLIRQLGKNIPNQNSEETKNIPPVSTINKVSAGTTLPPNNISFVHIEKTQSSPRHIEDIKSQTIAHKQKFNSPEEFVEYVMPFAEEAADELGVSATVLIAQAALETGWGKAVIQRPDGSSSYNLFNIKADQRWDGERVNKTTLEYHNGEANFEKASFRAYDSYAGSFNDYVDFLRTNNRYSRALQHQGDDQIFIKDLHEAGYATDPNYANKVINIMSRDSITDYAQDKISLKSEQQGVINGRV